MRNEEETKFQPIEGNELMNRQEFLKVLGIALGTAGLGLASGGLVWAQEKGQGIPKPIGKPPKGMKRSSPVQIQKFVKNIVGSEKKMKAFVANPKEYTDAAGIKLLDDDLKNIHAGMTDILKIVNRHRVGRIPDIGIDSDHVLFDTCHHVDVDKPKDINIFRRLRGRVRVR